LSVRELRRLRRSFWFFTSRHTGGAHAVAVTPGGKLVLVTLRYAYGWRLPGGGVKNREAPEEAVLRELREEIGMTSHGAVESVARFKHGTDGRESPSSLFVVRDIIYRAGWSIEVKAVGEFERSALPADIAPITGRLLAAADHVL